MGKVHRLWLKYGIIGCVLRVASSLTLGSDEVTQQKHLQEAREGNNYNKTNLRRGRTLDGHDGYYYSWKPDGWKHDGHETPAPTPWKDDGWKPDGHETPAPTTWKDDGWKPDGWKPDGHETPAPTTWKDDGWNPDGWKPDGHETPAPTPWKDDGWKPDGYETPAPTPWEDDEHDGDW